MKRRIVSIVLVCVLLVTATPFSLAADYSDVSAEKVHWVSSDMLANVIENELSVDEVHSLLSVLGIDKCTKCNGPLKYGYSTAILETYGEANRCCKKRITTFASCDNCGIVGKDTQDVVTGAHNWGSLNSDGYTRTCRTCGYTGQA